MNPVTEKYLQTGCFSIIDKLLSLLHTEIPYIINAAKATTCFAREYKTKSLNRVEVSIPFYDGKDATVIKIANYIKENLTDDLVGCYVHGSTGSNEMISYSDFDGVVIIKDENLTDSLSIKRIALHLQITYKMMLQLDPLQHHGWFIFSESDLNNFPDDRFPVELFRHAKSLLAQGNNLSFCISENTNYKDPFSKLSSSLRNKTKSKCPLTLYEIKSLLSEFMLLPALYIQARNGSGIFKRESFTEAKKLFSADEWNIMDKVSAVRSSWHYHPIKRREAKAWKYRRVKIISHFYRSAAPKELVNKIDALLPEMNVFVRRMSSENE